LLSPPFTTNTFCSGKSFPLPPDFLRFRLVFPSLCVSLQFTDVIFVVYAQKLLHFLWNIKQKIYCIFI